MDAASLSTEFWVLAASVVLLVVHISWQGMSFTADVGPGYNMGPRDAERPASVLTGRLKRALANYLETYPAFVGLALALEVTGQTGGLGAAGAVIWLLARIVYLPLYAFGVFRIRSIVWLVSLAGIVMMLAALVV